MASAIFANAVSREQSLRIKVLSAESHQTVIAPDQGSRDCDLANYSGYCHGTRTQSLQNVMLVQDSDGNLFRVSCTVETRWSKCVPLQVGSSFDARREKHGITIFFISDNGKPKKQLYTFLAPGKDPNPPVLQTTALSVPDQSQVSTVPATAPTAGEAVKCNFTSSPSGAEITLDGQYFGSTPSVLRVNPGTHVVALFAPGFARWEKRLTVSSGSEVTVNASLQKSP
jgi:hypothetical protein